jgi:hypothetical protein
MYKVSNFTGIIVGIFILLLHSCQEQKEQNYKNCENFSYADVLQSIALKGEILNFDDVINPVNLYIRDSFLFVANTNTEYLMASYTLPDMKKIGEFIPFGNGPDEALRLRTLQFVDSSVWGFDKERRRLLQYDYIHFIEGNKNTKPQKVVTIKDAISDKALVVGDKLYTNSFVHKNYRFSIFDMEGNLVKNTGMLPDNGKEMTDLERLEGFFCNMALKPDNELIFVSYMETDLIEIYDNEGNLKIRKHGPDHFFPYKIEKTDANGMTRVASARDKSRDAYFSPVAFEDEVWVSYYGKVFDPTKSDYLMTNKIIVFDWNGVPLRIYTTDIPYLMLAVDRKNDAIYGVTCTPDYTIVRFTP